MDDDKRRRSVSRHSARASRSLSSSRSRRHHRQANAHSRSRSVDRRRRRKRSVSRSRSRDRRHKSRSKSRRHHRSSKKRSRSHSRRKSDYASKSEEIDHKSQRAYEKESSKSMNNRINLDGNSSNSSMKNNPKVTICYNDDEDEPIDKERIHREMEQKLRDTLAREGKVYPPKKPEASHPVFANDGSFLEIFKKIQEQQTVITNRNPIIPLQVMSTSPTTAAYVAATASGRSAPPPPIVGRRRGGKILKTGMVAKQRVHEDGTNADPKDFWSLYLAEVNKYKNTACESETGNRPLVK